MKNEIKIKGSLNQINKKHILTVFCSSLVICLLLRFYQAAKLIDNTTGFFIKDSFITVLFYLILFVSSFAMLLMSFLSSDIRKLEDNALEKNKPLGIISILLSLTLFIDFFDQILVSHGNNQIATNGTGLFSSIAAKGIIPARFQMCFALLALLYYIIIAIRIFKGKEILGKYKILCTVPAGWAIVKLISLFATQISFIRVSDLFLEIVTNSFAVVFLLAYAQCISGVYEKEARWRMCGAGLAFALVALCTQIPRFIFTVFGKTDFVNSDYIIDYAVLMLAVFAVILILTMFIKQKYQDNLADEFEIKVPQEEDSCEGTDNNI